MNAFDMLARCMTRQDPSITPPVLLSRGFESVEGHDDSLARVADEGVVEGHAEWMSGPARNDAGEVVA